MTDPPDRSLVTAVMVEHDERAFRILYRRHTPALHRTARRLGDQGSADDLVHDTWLRATDRWHAFAWRSSLRTWLTGILVNVIREQRRSDRLRREDPLDDDTACDPPPIDDRLDLEAAIAALPPGSRAVLVLHDVEGHPHEDVARMLDIAVGTSKSQLLRARRRLRRWLGDAPEAAQDRREEP
ncbi:MAG: RNA polymerase sigma factor [Gemmatimonadetes bacterium]|nr:RNA polymerase sigma factor [Gemmatimonadota bacterium]